MHKLLFIITLLGPFQVSPAAIPVAAPPVKPEAVIDQALAGLVDTLTPSIEQGALLAVPTDKNKKTFYDSYLSVYYPRARVIGGYYFCLKLSPEGIEQALHDIVRLLKDKPWYYFQNTPDNFNHGHHWIAIIDQLSIIHEYLVRLRVDPVTKLVYHPAPGDKRKVKFLFDYLLDEIKSVALPQLLAFSYDYFIALYIDAIKREDVVAARYYYEELSYLQGNLRNTVFEQDYQEHFSNIVRSLFDLLKKRIGMSDAAIEEMAMRKNKSIGGGYAS
jgi:hypothetical protein